MHIEQLTSQVSASDQLCEGDVEKLVAMGVELLVCNRPDGEDVGQTPYEEIAAQAKRHGLETQLLAFSSYQITEDNRDALIKLIRTRKRIHLYCRSASRSKRLWREANAVAGGEQEYIESKSTEA